MIFKGFFLYFHVKTISKQFKNPFFAADLDYVPFKTFDNEYFFLTKKKISFIFAYEKYFESILKPF